MEEQACAKCRMVIEEEAVRYGGMILQYCLLICKGEAERFRIRVSVGVEAAEYGIGDCLDTALEYYRILVRGRVTPCCLGEVLEELCG